MNKKHIIKELRLRKGFTQAHLAEISSLSQRTIQRIENHEVEPTPYSLTQLGKALDVNLHKHRSNMMKRQPTTNSKRLGLFHLSSIFGLLFTAIIWIITKKDNEVVDYHGRDILNFKLNFLLLYIAFGAASLLMYKAWSLFLIALGILYSIALLIALYNAIRVSGGQDYQYPIFIRLFTHE